MNKLPKGSVPFHIDLHGKFNREEDRFIDLGTESMKWEFKEDYQPLERAISKSISSHMDELFKELNCDGFPV